MPKWKKRYKKYRSQFRNDIQKFTEDNPIFAMAVIETYVASQSKKHIHKIWYMLRNYKEAQREYNDTLFGESLCGDDRLFRILYFCNRALHDKYCRKIPDCLAMGDAYGIALKIANKK